MDLFLLIALYVVGLGFILAEMFLPGGILGLLGVVGMVGGVVLAFLNNESLGWTLLAITGIIIPLLVVVWIKVLNRFYAIKSSEEGVSTRDETLVELEGQEGVTVSALRPSGVATISDRRIDVVSQGDMIDSGTRIKVVEVKGNRVVVRKSAL